MAFWSLIVEAVGQGVFYFGPHRYWAWMGSVLSGAGYSLVVSAFGVEAVHRVPAESRGAAMAGYLIFFDLAFGAAIPVAGLLADAFTIGVVYLLGLASAIAGLVIAIKMTPRNGNPVQRQGLAGWRTE